MKNVLNLLLVSIFISGCFSYGFYNFKTIPDSNALFTSLTYDKILRVKQGEEIKAYDLSTSEVPLISVCAKWPIITSISPLTTISLVQIP